MAFDVGYNFLNPFVMKYLRVLANPSNKLVVIEDTVIGTIILKMGKLVADDMLQHIQS